MALPHLSAQHSLGRPWHTRIRMTRGRNGKPLPPELRHKLEQFYNFDFGDVRIHEGPEAAAIGALAFTHGHNIYMAPGRYNPDSEEGIKLLGHELAHVVQQSQGRVANPHGYGVAVVQDRELEREADQMGAKAAEHVLGRPLNGACQDSDCGHEH